jgi:hypothetical protein
MTWTGTTPFSEPSIFEGRSDGDLGGVLVDMSSHLSLADLGLCNAFLVASHGSDDTERPGVHL